MQQIEESNSDRMKEMTLEEYRDQQLEKSDMFLFIKHVNPSLFKKYIAAETSD